MAKTTEQLIAEFENTWGLIEQSTEPGTQVGLVYWQVRALLEMAAQLDGIRFELSGSKGETMTQPKTASKSSSHTPGPWAIIGGDIEGDGVTLVHLVEQSAGDDHEANARLIAQAPEMYELLKLVIHFDMYQPVGILQFKIKLQELIGIARRIKAAINGEG